MKLVAILIFLFYSACSSAQHIPNAVDRIHSQKSLERFVKKQLHKAKVGKDQIQNICPAWIRNQNDTGRISIKFYERFQDSIKTDSWVRKDINHDGKTDLLIRYRNYDGVVCFLSNRKNSFKLTWLGSLYTSGFLDRIYLKDCTAADIDGFVVYEVSLNRRINKGRKRLQIKVDTLVYKFGAFVSFNKIPTAYKYSSISIKTTPCYGTCPVYEMTINSKGEVFYNAEEYCEPNKAIRSLADSSSAFHYAYGKYKCILQADSFRYLCSTLDYINPPKLDSFYSIPCTDLPTIYLDIIYDEGREVKIQDYREQGTYGLMAFYDYIENLRRNLKWVKISDK